MCIVFLFIRYQKMTENEKREFNKVEAAPEDTGPLVKRLRAGFTEPLVKTAGTHSGQQKCCSKIIFVKTACRKLDIAVTLEECMQVLFSSTGQRPAGLMSWSCVRRVCVRACVNFFFKHLLLLNYWSNSDEISQKCFWGKPLSNLLKFCPWDQI